MIVKTKTAVECTHCGLPVPAGLLDSCRDEQFCCSGCKGAYELIHANGLETFYRMVEKQPNDFASLRFVNSGSEFQEYDEPVFQEKFATRLGDRRGKIEMAVEGMHCGACIWLIEKLPTILPGVMDARVNWGRRTVSVIWGQDAVALSTIAKTLCQLGYRPEPLQPNSNLDRWKRENRLHVMRIGVAAACAGNNMIISATLYLGMFSYMTAGITELMRVASGIVGLVALFWPGRIFLTSALAAIRTRTPHMDLPIALALGVGTLAGLINVIRGTGEIYFDSLSVLIFLLLIGRWIQFRQQAKAASSVELLQQLTPKKTLKLVDGTAVEILVDLVQVDDVLRIRTGELFPADGEIEKQETVVDESILTGESAPIKKSVGDYVFGGTTNIGSEVAMRVARVGTATRIHRLVELVEQASRQKPQMVQWANRIGGYFVVAVVSLAIFTFAWWSTTAIESALERSIALLIIACPCALALATPLSIAIALGRAAKQKIMIKGGDVFQSLQQPGLIWLDKTGTVTDGNLRVVRWFGESTWLKTIVALEKNFAHPVARALVDFGSASEIELNELNLDSHNTEQAAAQSQFSVFAAENHPGLGITGRAGVFDVTIGSASLLARRNIPITEEHQRLADEIIHRGGSPCWVAIDSTVVGIAELQDSIRPDAAEAIHELKRRGWQVGILSGDHQRVVDRVAGRLGIDKKMAIGDVHPEEKLSLVQENDGKVVMVGDGVNDSAALAAASVGIAVKNSAEASLAAAPVYFAKPGLNPLINLLDLSSSTTRTMQINLSVSLVYNVSFAAMAFFGYINPLVAAILMPLSSITVVALAMGAGRTQSFFSVNQGVS